MEEDKKTISLNDVANVIDAFNIQVIIHCKHLIEWENAVGSITPSYQEVLEEARQDLFINRNQWNEEELKMNFISLVLRASHVEIPHKIKIFYERPLIGNIQGYDFSMICDCMIATPTAGGRPKAPYFFLQEFKKGKGDRIDAEAQALIAMLLAQQENKDKQALYGAWLIGENWSFTVLTGDEYCVSKQYVATNPADLQKIVYMLQYLKTVILER
jgi:hypothetical protein